MLYEAIYVDLGYNIALWLDNKQFSGGQGHRGCGGFSRMNTIHLGHEAATPVEAVTATCGGALERLNPLQGLQLRPADLLRIYSPWNKVVVTTAISTPGDYEIRRPNS